MVHEIWKEISGYDGLYEISNLGRVKSYRRDKENGFVLSNLMMGPKRKRYPSITLFKDKKKKHFRIHHLVMNAFVGPRPEGLIVDHVDNNPMNNNVDNLRYTSYRENNTKDRVGKTSKYPGVHRDRYNNWVSQIKENGRMVYLGYFKKEHDAFLAYCKKRDEIENKDK